MSLGNNLIYSVLLLFLAIGCKYRLSDDKTEKQFCRRGGITYILREFQVDGNDSMSNLLNVSNQLPNLVWECVDGHLESVYYFGVDWPQASSVPRKMNASAGDGSFSIDETGYFLGIGPLGTRRPFKTRVLEISKKALRLQGDYDGHTYYYNFQPPK